MFEALSGTETYRNDGPNSCGDIASGVSARHGLLCEISVQLRHEREQNHCDKPCLCRPTARSARDGLSQVMGARVCINLNVCHVVGRVRSLGTEDDECR